MVVSGQRRNTGHCRVLSSQVQPPGVGSGRRWLRRVRLEPRHVLDRLPVAILPGTGGGVLAHHVPSLSRGQAPAVRGAARGGPVPDSLAIVEVARVGRVHVHRSPGLGRGARGRMHGTSKLRLKARIGSVGESIVDSHDAERLSRGRGATALGIGDVVAEWHRVPVATSAMRWRRSDRRHGRDRQNCAHQGDQSGGLPPGPSHSDPTVHEPPSRNVSWQRACPT